MIALVPRWVWEVLAGLALLVGAYLFGDQHGRGVVQAKWDAERAAMAQAAHDAQAAEDARAKRQTDQVQEIPHEQAALAASANAQLSDARTALASLRHQLQTLRSAPACSAPAAPAASEPDVAASAPELLGQCSVQLQSVAASADALSIQVTGLQQYIKAVNTP